MKSKEPKPIDIVLFEPPHCKVEEIDVSMQKLKLVAIFIVIAFVTALLGYAVNTQL